MEITLHRLIGDYIKSLPPEQVRPFVQPLREWCDLELAYSDEIQSLCRVIATVPSLQEHRSLRRVLQTQAQAVRDNEAQCLALLQRVDARHPLTEAVKGAYAGLARDVETLNTMLTLSGFMSLTEDPSQ